MRTILALDLATNTGWALNRPLSSGTCNFSNKKSDGAGMRYLKFYNWINRMISEHSVDMVSYELVRRHVSTDASHVYGGFLSQLQTACERASVPYTSYGVGTIKKHATGSGRASKEDMIEAAKRLYSTEKILDDNQADALCILSLTEEEFN